MVNWAGSKLWRMSNWYILARAPWSALFVSYAMLHKLTSGAQTCMYINIFAFPVFCIWFCFAGASRYRGALRRLDAVHCCVTNSNMQLAGRHKNSLLCILCCRVKTVCKNVQEGIHVYVYIYIYIYIYVYIYMCVHIYSWKQRMKSSSLTFGWRKLGRTKMYLRVYHGAQLLKYLSVTLD